MIKKIESILDYGCATGDKLNFFANNGTKFCYGIDINKNALNTCNKKFNKLDSSKKTYFFDSHTNNKKLNRFLEANYINKFDLIIFDRSLYCLNDRELMKQLNILTNYAKIILINDFMLDNNLEISGYIHRNWIDIMKNFDFDNLFVLDLVSFR